MMDDGRWKNHVKYFDIKNKKLIANTIIWQTRKVLFICKEILNE